MLKPVVLFLALLAVAKLGHEQYLFRTATRDAILGAYREHATEACQRQARGMAQPCPRRPGPVRSPSNWSSARVASTSTCGRSTNALWSARFRNPYLLLTAGQYSGTIYCEYDILNAAASVHRL